MSHPSLIEIEPTTSEFSLKYNNQGTEENVITINPAGKYIDGHNSTLVNFNYNNIDIKGATIEELSIENLLVKGNLTDNTFNIKDPTIIDSVSSDIKLSSYLNSNPGGTGDLEIVELSKNIFISPDKDYMILGEKIPFISGDVPELYLLKYNNSSKKYIRSFSIKDALFRRYGAKIFPEGKHYFNSEWSVNAMKDTNNKYTRLIIIHKHTYNPALEYTLTPASNIGKGYTIVKNVQGGDGIITQLDNPSGTTMYVMNIKVNYDGIDIAIGDTINNKDSSIIKFELFNDINYQFDSSINKINPNSIRNFVIAPEIQNPNNNTIDEKLNLFYNGASWDWGINGYPGYKTAGQFKTVSYDYKLANNDNNRAHYLFDAGGYSGIQIIDEDLSKSKFILVPFYVYDKNALAGQSKYRPYMFLYKLDWNNNAWSIAANGNTYASHKLSFMGRTEFGIDGKQLSSNDAAILAPLQNVSEIKLDNRLGCIVRKTKFKSLIKETCETEFYNEYIVFASEYRQATNLKEISSVYSYTLNIQTKYLVNDFNCDTEDVSLVNINNNLNQLVINNWAIENNNNNKNILAFFQDKGIESDVINGTTNLYYSNISVDENLQYLAISAPYYSTIYTPVPNWVVPSELSASLH